MTVEIERKFLVGRLPSAHDMGRGELLRQGYVAIDGDANVRVRLTDAGATLTIKAGGGVARTEVELAVTPEQAEALWAHTAGRRIEKRRHRVSLGTDGPTAEVDVYAGDLLGLLIVEVEFDTLADAEAFDPPPWFGNELTGDPSWSNAALASGRPRP